MEATKSKEWTLSAGRFGELPAVMRYRRAAFENDAGKPEYTTAVVVQIAINEPNDEGLPTSDEGDTLRDIEVALQALHGDRGQLVSVITGLGLRQFTWYSTSEEWAPHLLEGIDANITSHGVHILTRSDPAWDVARQLLDWRTKKCSGRRTAAGGPTNRRPELPHRRGAPRAGAAELPQSCRIHGAVKPDVRRVPSSSVIVDGRQQDVAG